jgi:hypothetical protein
MTRNPERHTLAPPPISESMTLLQAARGRGLLSEEEFDMALALLLRRAGLHPNVVTKAPQ